jgi:hypothetical protein
VGESALDCHDHVPVSDRLVADDGDERREHENDEADRHGDAEGSEEHGDHKDRGRDNQQDGVKRVGSVDQERVQREEYEHENRNRCCYGQHSGGGVEVCFLADVVRCDVQTGPITRSRCARVCSTVLIRRRSIL